MREIMSSLLSSLVTLQLEATFNEELGKDSQDSIVE